MLILTRKQNQSIVINGNIVITVLANHGNTVRIGVDAPRDISVHREEVYEKIKIQQLQSKSINKKAITPDDHEE